MDLIYTNAKGKELGVLKSYEYDNAFGTDENDFCLTLPLKINDIEKGSLIYAEGTEYGGIVDAIEVNTDTKEILYKGRTWHGFLSKKVICPENGYDVYTVSGNANRVLEEIIKKLSLQELFEVHEIDSSIYIDSYTFEPFVDAYTGIKEMLWAFGGKLIMERQQYKTVLAAVPVVNYFADEEWNQAQFMFNAQQNFKPINHVICHSTDEETNKQYTIHLFVKNGGILLPYAINENPQEDSEYIITTEKQFFSGLEELAEAKEVNFSTVSNYIPLVTKPADWETNYADYSYLDEEGTWQKEKLRHFRDYVLLGSAPADWGSNYESYYYLEYEDEEPKYKKVKGNTVYEPLTTIDPEEWANNSTSYYTIKEDYKSEDDKYRQVTEQNKVIYVPQGKKKPPEWDESRDTFYYKTGENSYSQINDKTEEKYKLMKGDAPVDWNWNYTSYKKNATEYESVSLDESTLQKNKPNWKKDEFYSYNSSTQTYSLTKTQPKNWDSNWYDYYTRYASPYYNEKKMVQYIGSDSTAPFVAGKLYQKSGNNYIRLEAKPPSFYEMKMAGQIYYYNGTVHYNYSYEKLASTVTPKWKKNKYYSKNTSTGAYSLTKTQPKNWQDNWSSYFTAHQVLVNLTKSEDGKAPKYKAGKYYGKVVYTYPAIYEDCYKLYSEIYKKVSIKTAPDFEPGKYYRKLKAAPSFTTNTYYEHQDYDYIPEYVNGTYYRTGLDHYKKMVEEGIEVLKEAWASNKIEINFDADQQDYDIGDIVGATESITGITVFNRIIKKILRIQTNGTVNIEYKIAEE